VPGERSDDMDDVELPGPPAVEPPDPHETGVVVVGMVAWLVALVVLLVLHDDLRRHHTEWWLWSCLLGLALGVYGLRVARRRR
jgi:Co/Zn/Cd efflux system component